MREVSVGPARDSSPIEKRVFLAILAAFALFSTVYNVVTPAGEGVDEVPHLHFTLYVKNHLALPILPAIVEPDSVLMAHHPPLYYVLAALLVAPLDTSDLSEALVPNPHFVWIEGYGPGNRNVYLHSPITGQDPFPYRGVVLAIHLLRVASTAQGVAALVVARRLLRRLLNFQSQLVLAAVAATAFQPTFLSTFSLAHHDGTVALLTLLGIEWAGRFGAPATGDEGRASPLIGGAILGLALLVKTDAIVLIPVYLVATAVKWHREQTLRPIVRPAIQIGAVAGAIAGWWYVRNLILYDDPLAQNAFAATHPSLLRQGTYTFGDVIAFFQQLQITFWGAFGDMHVLVDPRVGDALSIVVAIAIPGFVMALQARRDDSPLLTAWLISGTAIAALLAVFLRYSVLVFGVGHGRFFVAVIPVVIGLTVLGLNALQPFRLPILPFAFATAMVGYGALVPFLVIEPAYRPPISDSIPPGSGSRASFGGQLALVGEAIDPPTVRPGESTTISLFWQRARSIDSDLRFRVRVLARDGSVIFDHEYWPAGGGVPTATWPAGVTYRDTLSIPVPGNAAPGVAIARVSVHDSNGKWLEASPQQTEVDVARVAIATIPTVPSLPTDAVPLSAVFDNRLELVGARVDPAAAAGGVLTTTAYWRAQSAIDEDLTVSVQVLTPDGRLVAQDDAEPAHGQAPTTTWAPQTIVVDHHQIHLPSTLAAGRYRVIAIVYGKISLTRLTVDGRNPPESSVVLGDLDVTASGG